jgi:hypothetical protein
VQKIAERFGAFGKSGLPVQRHSRVFDRDQPLKAGSTWLSFYNVRTPAPNLTRINVDGSTAVNNDPRLSVNPSDPQAPQCWQRPLQLAGRGANDLCSRRAWPQGDPAHQPS